MKTRQTNNKSYWPDEIDPVSYDNGVFTVPEEWKDYYATCWKWKKNMGIYLEKYKLSYLDKYEKEFGEINYWVDNNGKHRPMPTPGTTK